MIVDLTLQFWFTVFIFIGLDRSTCLITVQIISALVAALTFLNQLIFSFLLEFIVLLIQPLNCNHFFIFFIFPSLCLLVQAHPTELIFLFQFYLIASELFVTNFITRTFIL